MMQVKLIIFQGEPKRKPQALIKLMSMCAESSDLILRVVPSLMALYIPGVLLLYVVGPLYYNNSVSQVYQ